MKRRIDHVSLSLDFDVNGSVHWEIIQGLGEIVNINEEIEKFRFDMDWCKEYSRNYCVCNCDIQPTQDEGVVKWLYANTEYVIPETCVDFSTSSVYVTPYRPGGAIGYVMCTIGITDYSVPVKQSDLVFCRKESTAKDVHSMGINKKF